MREEAPAKLNLCLYVGPIRDDGRHALVSVMTPLDLADAVTLEPSGGQDEVICTGVEGPNLAHSALRRFREATAWDGGAVRITIEKRIPVAAGLGGGSADAAAALRLLHRASGLGDTATLLGLAARLGSDVPSQLDPRTVLVLDGGETLEHVDPAGPRGVLVLPSSESLSTGAVYERFDALGLKRSAEDLDQRAGEIRGGRHSAVNDLEPASISLCPGIEEALDAARSTDPQTAMVAGSGPTVVALYPDRAAAERAGERLVGRDPAPIVTSLR